MSNPNPYTFPAAPYEANGHITYYEGMTLRDWFAGQVIGAIYTRSSVTSTNEDDVRAAYALADAMLAERAKVAS